MVVQVIFKMKTIHEKFYGLESKKSPPAETFFCRFNAVVLRARFDESNAIKDMRILAQMLEDGEK